MIDYKDYEKRVYNWFKKKQETDNKFTFSVRLKASKGSEKDYFIGTKKSGYFATTFWTMPVNFPGSSGDCISIIFGYKNDSFIYSFEFAQTNSPEGQQNTSALNLLKSINKSLNGHFAFSTSGINNKMYTIKIKSPKKSYQKLDELLEDVEKDLTKIFPIVDVEILKEKTQNLDFIAHRITVPEFNSNQEKLTNRLKKYINTETSIDESKKIRNEFTKWLKGSETSNKIASYLRALNILNELLEKDIYLEKNIESLNSLYNDLIIEQRVKGGKYYYTDAPSYGLNGFYSASINSFISFLQELKRNNNKSELGNYETSLNQIFYGPPGTGKTFYLKDQLFEKYTSRETSITEDQHFEAVVSKCSWWQVIAIALLDFDRAKVSDIFNHKWVQKKASLSSSNTIRPTLWGQLQSHTINECEFVKVSNRQQPLLFEKTEDSYWKILEEQVEELVPELYDLKDSVENYNPDPDKIIKHFDFVTFHQSFAYEDFIEGIKPIIPEIDSELEEAKDLGYTIEDGVFKDLCSRAKNDPNKRYAIFIDEINRGNVSAIFGELITLIETDKRKGAKNEMSIKLPYSKKEFSVPSNLDIYGTMNTADRSVEALDTALRRRFEFKEMMPDYNVIENEFVEGVQLFQVLQTINERIELLIDRDHTIGHSFLVNVNTKQKLANAFNNRIVPLLQEYFYGDYGKIGLVLGKGFVEKFKNDNIDFANFDYENANDFKITSYKLKQVNTDNVIEAIALLLGSNETATK